MVQNKDAIPEPVHTQLLSLGIPAASHTPDALANLFPPEFNISAADLNAEDLAKVLVYFAEHGILDVSGTKSRTGIKQVKPGWHCCRFYRDDGQLLDMIAPYIVEGLQNGEACLWVVPTHVSCTAACEAIGRRLSGIKTYLESGQLELYSYSDWYLDPLGRLKTFEEISGALLLKETEARARGFKFLRASGDAGWVSGTDESKAFIDYEMKVNAALGATNIAAVCTFHANVTADELVHIVTAHKDALLKATV